jgi:hypothetical protein
MKKYVQGESVDFTVQLLKKDEDEVSRPFDLTGNTEISMIWKASTSVIKKNRVAATVGVVILGASTEGKIKGTLLPADTETQPKNAAGLIEIVVTFSATDIKKFQVKGAFAVEEKAG